jgi:hypothetical protein
MEFLMEVVDVEKWDEFLLGVSVAAEPSPMYFAGDSYSL